MALVPQVVDAVPVPVQIAMNDIKSASVAQESGEYYPMYAGQGVGMIHDLPGAADIVRAVIEEARQAMEELPQKIRF